MQVIRASRMPQSKARPKEFWPPSETIRPEYDDFAALFHQGAASSVAWEEAP